MLDYLPEDVIIEIITYMDIPCIEHICSASLTINKICHQNNHIKQLIISKLSKDSLIVKDFTLEQLFFYNKIIPLKRKITVAYNGAVYVNLYDKLFMVDNNTKIVKAQFTESNQLTEFHYQIYILNNKCIISAYDSFWGKKYKKLKIINMVQHNNLFTLLTVDGKHYHYDPEQKELCLTSNIPNIIQLFGDYTLTSKGEVYRKNTKVEDLPEIIQITEHGFFLAANGNVYRYTDGSVITVPINNIKQIYSTIFKSKQIIAYLDNNGDVFTGDFENKPIQEPGFSSSIIEISFIHDNLISLTNKWNLNIREKMGIKDSTYYFQDYFQDYF